MVIILNDDPVYVSWIRRHRNGFVLDTKRKSTKRNSMLHRATCPMIRKSKTERTHWTTGGRVKACSDDCGELTEWALEQIGSQPKACGECNPLGDALSVGPNSPIAAADHHLTKLENDVLSAVVESAVIHLDNELDFRMTVRDVAEYLSKTPAQVTDAMRRLVAQQMLEIETAATDKTPLSPTVRVFPTEGALRTVPAFAELKAEQLQGELEALRA